VTAITRIKAPHRQHGQGDQNVFQNVPDVFRADHVDNLQSQADAIRAAQVETQKELDALMPSVLAKAFAGEL